MGYMQDFETKLRTLIDQGEPTDKVVDWVKKEIYQSYKNGLEGAGKQSGKRSSHKKWSKD